ncbi:glucosyl transferase [Vibrio orientalis CIP 102891 = ATCC 33934]|uniref:Glucosyl transferase n=1 Tax=Vibrio orientalis CIP 102891 = ATCC 33934 TaxID=675816 RepID=C9QDF0_VIBOR|nr:glycosyltransferase [Vibrio orientalis]EEX95052.1 putative glucosyl transferase [Vibrio orientalis CIP 102891 = ATCC 33934]EGU52113.1 glucosyl transferase [Vibrio orientalis CIP 102891 = ATCC 33934]
MSSVYDLCILIPAFNEGNLPVNFSKEILFEFHQEFPDTNVAIVIIDDGSAKENIPILSDVESVEFSNITILGTHQNLGKDSALYYGLCRAPEANYYCAIDGDGEQPASLLIQQWKLIHERGSRLVLANREKPTTSESLLKNIMRKSVRVVSSRLFSVEIDGLTDCIMFEKKIRKVAVRCWNKNKLFRFIPWRIFLATFLKPDDSVKFQASRADKEGGSRFSSWRLVRLGLRCLLLNPNALSKIVYGGLGFCVVASLLPIGFVIVDWLAGTLYPGYMTITALLSMILWSTLGILSLSLSRLIVDVRNLQTELED